MRGVIKAWFNDRGYGWIHPDARPHDVFAHIRDVAGQPRVGATVEFQENDADKNSRRPYATDVKILS